MRHTEILGLVLVVGLAACVTPTGTGTGTQPPPEERGAAPVEMLEAPGGPPAEARAAFTEAARLRDAKDYVRALAAFDKVLQVDPNHFDALHDSAWILATHQDTRTRNPKRALELAYRASSNLAKWGLLRKDKEAYPDMATTGRNMLIMSTIAGSLAANGKFRSEPARDLAPDSAAKAEQDALSGSMLMSAGCDGATLEVAGSAIAVQGFAVDAAREMNRRFPQVAETKVALDRAEALMKMYKEGKMPTGQEPIAWSTSVVTRLR